MSDPMLFVKKDFAAIVQDMLRDLADPAGGRVALADVTEGSVVRTLVEAFAHELAVAYEQLGAVYRLGYLETATGKALDQVVALVGLTRQKGGHAEGLLRFSRSTAAPADIRIPAGTLVAGRSAPPVETLTDAVLDAGSRFVLVRGATVEPASEPIPAGGLDQLVRPLLGVDAVSNPGELIVTAEVETDDELRARARFSLRRGQLGTCEGIEAAVRGLGVRSVRVSEGQPDRPGFVDVVIGDTDLDAATIAAVNAAIDDARPAGVRIRLRLAEPVMVVVTVKPVLARVTVADDEVRVRDELAARIRKYLEGLAPDDAVVVSKLRALVLDHPDVREIAVDAAGRAELAISTTLPGVLKNPAGDLCVEGGKRAVVDRIDVLLQPPIIDVWVDVVARRLPGAGPADALRPAIEKALRDGTDAEFAAAGQTSREIGFDALKKPLAPLVLPIELVSSRATRSTTGQSIALTPGSKPLRLKPRERLTVRAVEVIDG